MDIKRISSERLKRNGKHVVGNWSKGNPCYIAIENLAELCFTVAWKEEFISDEIGYLAEEIFKHIIEGMAWFLLFAYSKM